MMGDQLVSVILPFLNAETTLDRALDSLAASSHSRFEALLIDDASTDRSPDIATKRARQDSRFRYVRNPENRHVSFSRNLGLDGATGAYIAFVDSDDWISPDWIHNLVSDAGTSGAEIVIGQSRRIRNAQDSDYRMQGLDRHGMVAFREVVFKDNSVVWNKLYAAALLKRIDLRFEEDLRIGEDLLFNFLAMSHAEGIYVSGKGHYYYNAENEASIMRSSSPRQRLDNLSRLLERLVEESRKAGVVKHSVLAKVARDILRLRYEFNVSPVDPQTMTRIRHIGLLLPAWVRLSVFRKSLRRALRIGPMTRRA